MRKFPYEPGERLIVEYFDIAQWNTDPDSAALKGHEGLALREIMGRLYGAEQHCLHIISDFILDDPETEHTNDFIPYSNITRLAC